VPKLCFFFYERDERDLLRRKRCSEITHCQGVHDKRSELQQEKGLDVFSNRLKCTTYQVELYSPWADTEYNSDAQVSVSAARQKNDVNTDMQLSQVLDQEHYKEERQI
jgi:hypothetical protein